MDYPLTIKLSPLLAYEVYSHTVETGLYDHRAGKDVGLKPADISLYEKIEKDYRNLVIDNIDEAASLYNELYNLIDFFYEWAENEGVKWYAVAKAAKKHMATLRALGLQLNDRGWARQ